MLDMAKPEVQPPPHLRGLNICHKEQNRLWQ